MAGLFYMILLSLIIIDRFCAPFRSRVALLFVGLGPVTVASLQTMQTLERQVERFENALTFNHLATLPKVNKDHFLSSFTREQQHFLQQYLHEGLRDARSWDGSEPLSPPKVNPPAFPKNDPQLGFGTPVLRARLDLGSTRKGYHNGSIKAGRNRTAAGHESSKENERPSGHSENLPDAVENNLKSKAEWQKKNVCKADKKRAKERNLRSDSDNELVQRQLATLIST
jgi:hypothetical protein